MPARFTMQFMPCGITHLNRSLSADFAVICACQTVYVPLFRQRATVIQPIFRTCVRCVIASQERDFSNNRIDRVVAITRCDMTRWTRRD